MEYRLSAKFSLSQTLSVLKNVLNIFHEISRFRIVLVMCLSHFCGVRVTSPSSQSHLKFCRVESESSHDLVKSSHNFSYIFLAIGPPVDLQCL